MKINSRIFREYDIRGIVDVDLTTDVVTALGKGFGTYLASRGIKNVVVGRDVRLSSLAFRDALENGLISTGISVLDIGQVPTPLVYYALFEEEPTCGVMITGSHNPPEYNGFKLCVDQTSIHGKEIQKIRKIIESEDFITGEGQRSEKTIVQDYINMVYSRIKINKKLKVVVDSGNGTGGLVAPKLLKKLGCEVIELFSKPDGNFPHHHPDPTVPKYMKTLCETVVKEKADIGIGFDGDSDRIGVVDENGKMILGDYLLLLYARDMLSRKPKQNKIVFEVKSSQNLVKDIEKHGGIPVMTAAGHSLIKDRMAKEKSLLGGEVSGHIFFGENYYGFDDAVYAAAKILEILSNSDKKISEMLLDLPQTYSTTEVRLFCPDELKFKIVDELVKSFSKEYEVITIDGVRINFKNGWGLIRSSNTQPVIVVRMEADTMEELELIKRTIVVKLKKYPEISGYEALDDIVS
ncbi:MAG: phosphomannomutase/phosphoglucomutase [Nitrospinae bacterium]|nr:phosphomannomutase/phosphoglucomutase [Nitrospinota bacterium]